MKEKIFNVFRWLSPKAIAKFFDFKELIAFILPTTGFYYDILPKIFESCKKFILWITILICLCILIYHLYKRYMDYEKAIAEIIETSYFSNFLDFTVYYLNQKIVENEDITFRFKDKSVKTVNANKIKLDIIIPLSKNELIKTIREISAITKEGTLDNGSWVKAKINDDETITIYECPRILMTFSKYLVNSEKSYSEEQSKKLHNIFDQKFNHDWNNISDKILPNFQKYNKLNILNS